MEELKESLDSVVAAAAAAGAVLLVVFNKTVARLSVKAKVAFAAGAAAVAAVLVVVADRIS